MRASLLPLAVVFGLAATARGDAPAEPPPLRLDALLAKVSQTAPQVRVQRAAVDAARAGVDVAGAWEDPRVSAMGSEFMLMGGDPAAQPMIRYQISQPLTPLFGRRLLAKAAATAQQTGAAAVLDRTRLDAGGQAFAAFYELWMNGEMAKLLARQLGLMARMRDSAKARYSSGAMMGHHEYLRASAEIAGMEAERASLDDERGAIVAMLDVLLGQPTNAPLGAPELPPRTALPELDAFLARIGNRPEVRVAEAMRVEMQARRGLADAEYYPMVMVGVAYEQQFRMSGTVGFDVAVTLPIWWWDRQNSMLAMADAMVVRADRDVEAMQSMTEAELRMSWSRARAAERRLSVLEESALPKMRESVASSESAYIAGNGEFLMLLDATLSLRSLESERLQAIVAREVAGYALIRLLGTAAPEVKP